MPDPITYRKKLEIMRSELETDRDSFLPQWRDIADFILPTRAQFQVTDKNRGDRRNLKIMDGSATLAWRTCQAGMMSGITSPSRPWKRLTTPDPDLAEFKPAKQWLHIVNKRMDAVLLQSNYYNIQPEIYGDMSGFGIGTKIIEEDFDDVARCYAVPLGSYCIANNDKLQVDNFFREFKLTVHQILRKFAGDNPRNIDWTKFSPRVKNMYDRGNYQTWIDICHFIVPNEEYDGNGYAATQKKYLSTYYEKGGEQKGGQEDRDLSKSGYDYFPVISSRWGKTGNDVYATMYPGSLALGDVKQLQHGEKRGLQALDKMVNPPLRAPMSLQKEVISSMPGEVTHVDMRDGEKSLGPLYEVDFHLQELEAKQAQVRQRCSRYFYEDLFLMMFQSDRRQITAREIDERHSEKLMVLGPVLEQLNTDDLGPTVEILFMLMDRQGYIPSPPEELGGVTLKIEYVSILHEAQKLAALSGVERFTGFVGSVAAWKMDILDKVDTDELVDEYGDIVGVPPLIIRSADQVKAIREGRAKVAQQQAQMAALAQGADTANKLAGAKLNEPSALTALMQQANAGA